ncbi:MAG: ATP-binding protein [Lachnospiraceae bacterium]|nr:ATP-binding protein [Lachnospiraceae bacterium]
MRSKQTLIGEIVSVNGNLISVQLLNTVKSNMLIIDGVVYRIGQIGSFLKIPLGYSNLFGIVTQTGASAIPESYREIFENDPGAIQNQQWLSMVLVGEQQGKKFSRGVSQSPTTGDSVHLVTIKDLDIIYDNYDEYSSIDVGNISISESLRAKIDLNKLITRHSRVLGSTGSGKSNAVGILLGAIEKKKFPSSRILLIDPHGEYNSVFREDSIVFKIHADNKIEQKELYIPFWALPYNELLSIFGGTLNDANREYLRNKIVEAKTSVVHKMRLDIEKEFITADSPIPFNIKQLWFELDDFERQTFRERAKPETKTNLKVVGNAEELISNEYEPASAGGGAPFLNNQAKGILGFLDNMRLKIKDSRYSFLFSPGGYTPNAEGITEKSLEELLFQWLGNPGKITILDFSDIPSEIMVSTAGTLLNIIYDALFWGQNLNIGGKNQPILVVLEEAHNYLKAGENSIASRTVQKVAKEGRKYGVGLMLVTQRPSELDETVMSQCGTIVALRMNNNKDRGHVRGAIQDELQTMIDLLPNLRTGEAIISGEAVKIPSRVQFYKLGNAPKGSDPNVTECWKSEPDIDLFSYGKLVSLWQNQKFREE